MAVGALRSFIGPLSRTLISRASTPSALSSSFWGASPSPKPENRFPFGFLFHRQSPCAPFANQFHGLTDTQFPKRRPVDEPRRRRAALRPAGPYAWVKYVPGEPILPNDPNEGSVKGRNEKKSMRQRREFIKAEAKKRKGELQEANRKKRNMRVERKMAAVARERAWAERLAELHRLEEEKKRTMA